MLEKKALTFYQVSQSTNDFSYNSKRNIIMDVSTKNKYSKNFWPSDKVLTLIIDKVSGDYGYQVDGKRYIQSYSNE